MEQQRSGQQLVALRHPDLVLEQRVLGSGGVLQNDPQPVVARDQRKGPAVGERTRPDILELTPGEAQERLDREVVDHLLVGVHDFPGDLEAGEVLVAALFTCRGGGRAPG